MCTRIRTALADFFLPPTTAQDIKAREREAERFFKPAKKILLWSCSGLLIYSVLACMLDWDSVMQWDLDDEDLPKRAIRMPVRITGAPLRCPLQEHATPHGENYNLALDSKLLFANGTVHNIQLEDTDEEEPFFSIGDLLEMYPYAKKIICSGKRLRTEVGTRTPSQKRLRIFVRRRKLRNDSIGRSIDIVLINLSSAISFEVILLSQADSSDSGRRWRSEHLHPDNLLSTFPRAKQVFMPLLGIQSTSKRIRRAQPKYPICSVYHIDSKRLLEAPPGGITVYRIGDGRKGPSLSQSCP